MIESKVDGKTIGDENTVGSLEYTKGSIACSECSGNGKCVDGLCVCSKHYRSSNGWSKDRKTIDFGVRGDCSYFVEYLPSQ